jgi:hypothetical protein
MRSQSAYGLQDLDDNDDDATDGDDEDESDDDRLSPDHPASKRAALLREIRVE